MKPTIIKALNQAKSSLICNQRKLLIKQSKGEISSEDFKMLWEWNEDDIKEYEDVKERIVRDEIHHIQ